MKLDKKVAIGIGILFIIVAGYFALKLMDAMGGMGHGIGP